MSVWVWLCPLLVLGVPLLYFAGKQILARRQMARAAEEHCLLCDSREIESRGDTYTCLDCGFDSSWSDDADIGPMLDQLRDLRAAERNFDEAAENMKYAKWMSTVEVFLGSAAGKRDYLQKAGKAQMRGLSTVEDLIDDHPDLLEMPVPGESVGSTTITDEMFEPLKTDLREDRDIEASRKNVEKFHWKVQRLVDGLVKRIREAGDERD